MPDLDQTQELVHRYLSARVPLVVVRSIEPVRVMNILRACAASLRTMSFYEHSRTVGLRELLSGQALSDDTSLHSALEHARTTFRSRNDVNFIFTDIEELDQESSTSRHLAEMVRLAESKSGSIILVTAKPVWSGLARLGMSESLDLPSTDELQATISAMVDDHRQAIAIDWQYAEVRQASEILTGITEAEAINVLATMLAKGSLANEDVNELSSFKDRIFGELTGIERIRLRDDYKVGGLRNLRQWLVSREKLMRTDLSHSPLRPPRGVLLVGVPGCGKSLSAKAIAADWNLPLYRLDMSAIMGMYMGQSESQLREALETADRVAPCVLWIDEIEKGLATGLGDTGTSRRLIGQFLFWLQESTSKVFLVATANDVSTLPPELLRKGRFDEMFFVDLPDAEDRAEILAMYFQRYLDHDVPPHQLDELVTLSEGFSGSDIDAVVHDIASQQLTRGAVGVPSEDEVVAHFRNVVPFSHTNSEDVALIRAWGLNRCVPAGSAPETVRDVSPGRRVVIL